MSLQNDIASAIQKADSSYFFENYTKQAHAVISALQKKGYAITPKEPTEDMIKAGTDSIMSGKVKPEALVKQVYLSMIDASGKK